MKKKSIVIAVLAIILINFITVNSFAEPATQMTEEEFENFNNGSAGVTSNSSNPDNSKTEFFGFNTSNFKNTSATSTSVITKLLSIPAVVGSYAMTGLVKTTGTRDTTSDIFTIQDLLFGKYDLFDINFFKYRTNDVLIPSDTTHTTVVGADNPDTVQVEDRTSVNAQIKTEVSKWYYILRNLSLTISVVILIYIAIRMVMSTVVEQKAKYKQMLIAWLTSVILIFVLHYIFLLIFYIFDILMAMLNNFVPVNVTVEADILNGVQNKMTQSSGWGLVPNVILYWMLVYFQLKFFAIYLFRVLEVSFLTIISPLVTITYPIDKAGDNKAQAFTSLLKTIIIKTFLQFIHATIYIIFIFSAGAIAQKVPLLAVLFFSALSRAEKIVSNTFKVQGKGLRDFKLRKLLPK